MQTTYTLVSNCHVSIVVRAHYCIIFLHVVRSKFMLINLLSIVHYDCYVHYNTCPHSLIRSGTTNVCSSRSRTRPTLKDLLTRQLSGRRGLQTSTNTFTTWTRSSVDGCTLNPYLAVERCLGNRLVLSESTTTSDRSCSTSTKIVVFSPSSTGPVFGRRWSRYWTSWEDVRRHSMSFSK